MEPTVPPSSSTPSSSTQEVPLRHFNASTNRYPAKKSWPPDMLNMDRKHQFRLERRYRRRSQTTYLQPGWVRFIKLAQLATVGAVVGYAVLWMEWDDSMGYLAKIRGWAGVEGSESTNRRIKDMFNNPTRGSTAHSRATKDQS